MADSSDGPSSGVAVDAIRPVFREHPVRLAVLFGSHARGDNRPDSDIDIAIEFNPGLSDPDRTTTRLDIIAAVTDRLKTNNIDVIPLDAASPDLQSEIARDGVVLYGDPQSLTQYQQDAPGSTHEEGVAEFDAVLAELERVV